MNNNNDDEPSADNNDSSSSSARTGMSSTTLPMMIRPPTTTDDQGQPSTSLVNDVRRVLALAQDERILAAQTLLDSVTMRLQEWQKSTTTTTVQQQNESEQSPTKKSTFMKFTFHKSGGGKQDSTEEHEEYRTANHLLESKREELNKLTQRAAVIQRARDTLNENEGWTLSQTLFGITTYYKREDNGSLSLKIEGQLDGVPLFEQVAVLREVDLHYKWSPFCTSSMTLKEIDKLDMVGWAVVGLPQFGLARDGCFRAFGCDCIMEDGSFFLVGQGVEDRPDNVPYDEPFFLQDMEGIRIPNPPTKYGSGRMTIRALSAVVHVLSPTSVRTQVVANINPNLAFIPQSLLDFVMRKMCGAVLSKLQHAAKKAAADPVRNAHAQKMRMNSAFYKDWLMPKFQAYCNHLGWEMPPVAAFSLTEEQLRHEAARWDNDDARSTPVRKLTSMESSMEAAPSTVGNGLHLCASAPDLQVQNTMSDSTSGGDEVNNNGSSDSTSAVSSISGSTSSKYLLRDNLIAQYLRELEEKTQQEKARKIQEGRRNMAEQLRPKPISESEHERLQELKRAKARRQRKRAASPLSTTRQSNVTETAPAEPFSVVRWLHTHGRRARFTVTSLLGLALQVTLHVDRIFGFDALLRLHADRIWMNILLDAATVVYLGISAAVFFVVSYVSLVYAFDSMSIGTKSGNRSKQFYGQTISFLVAATSGAIVVLSIGKAIAGVWLRVGLWYLSQAMQWVRHELQNGLKDQHNLAWFLDNVPKSIQSVCATALSHVSPLVRGFVGTGKSAILFVQHWFVVIVIRSNYVGRTLAALTMKTFGVMTHTATVWEDRVSNVLDAYADDDLRLSSWRGAAMDTARPLLAYTAVFLLTLLVLFNATTRTNTKEQNTGQSESETAASSVDSDTANFDHIPSETVTSLTSIKEAPRTQRYRSQSSVTVQEDIIPEGDEDMSVSDTQSCMTEMGKKKRFGRLRRLRKRKNRLVDDGNSVHSSVSDTSTRMKRLETY